jgi:hypothetical protein
MEPGEEQFVAECENDRADEQADDPRREKSTYAAIRPPIKMVVSTQRELSLNKPQRRNS